ncbi:ABC transporter ATP-binding protein [Spirochaetia bacterium]|nr:ABC transporter ATP-binding protein [Spirochaetia bacterium]
MGLLVTTKIGISFGGLVAVKDISIDVPEYKVISLIGPNGAGKTTVFNLLTGFYKMETGEITLAGESLAGLRPYQYIEKGMTRTFQNLRLFRQMTVLENVMIGHQRKLKYSAFDIALNTLKKKRMEKEARDYCCSILERVGLIEKKDILCPNLPYGQQKKLEIARALASDPKLILLDEPAAGLNPQETHALSAFIRSLLDYKITVLLIEHDMSLVMRISDYIYVMNQGEMLCEGSPEYVQADSKVIEAYIGKGGRKNAAPN